MSIKNELQDIISGNGKVKHGSPIQAINFYLRREKEADSNFETAKFIKKQETEILIDYIEHNNLWYKYFDESKYLGEGAEQKIYDYSDSNYIIKLNDSIFYEWWEDYFNSLLLHNYFFPSLAYDLLGFYKIDSILYAVVKQPFVQISEVTNLDNVKVFLKQNGFINKKANDYYNPELGLILEDLHDENVLTENGTLQFVDTIFYITPDFYK
jgi:hypothetical protein